MFYYFKQLSLRAIEDCLYSFWPNPQKEGQAREGAAVMSLVYKTNEDCSCV